MTRRLVDWTRIADLYQQGLTAVQVSRVVGSSPESVRRHLITQGVRLRSGSEQAPHVPRSITPSTPTKRVRTPEQKATRLADYAARTPAQKLADGEHARTYRRSHPPAPRRTECVCGVPKGFRARYCPDCKAQADEAQRVRKNAVAMRPERRLLLRERHRPDPCPCGRAKEPGRHFCPVCRVQAWAIRQERGKRQSSARRKHRSPAQVIAERLRYRITEDTRMYGFQPGEREALAVAQDFRCAICGRVPKGRGLVVDHCHDCWAIDRRGSVRPGLICGWCNTGKFYGNDAERHRQLLLLVARHNTHLAICPATAIGRAQQEDRDIAAMADEFNEAISYQGRFR